MAKAAHAKASGRALFAGVGLILLALVDLVFPRVNESQPFGTVFLIAGAVLVLLLIGFLGEALFKSSAVSGAPLNHEEGQKADQVQRARWWALIFISLAFCLLTLIGGLLALNPTPLARIVTLVNLVAATLIALLLLGSITGVIYPPRTRAMLDDELTKSFQGRAFATGFVVLAAGEAAAVALGLAVPEWRLPGPIFALGAGVVAATIRFALLERAAILDA